MSSMDEYEMTRAIPDAFQIDGGPIFHRSPLIEIVGDSIFWTWTSAGGKYRVVYGQSADENAPKGRAVFITGVTTPPMDAGTAMAEAVMPDCIAMLARVPLGKDKPAALMLVTDTFGLKRPGIN